MDFKKSIGKWSLLSVDGDSVMYGKIVDANHQMNLNIDKQPNYWNVLVNNLKKRSDGSYQSTGRTSTGWVHLRSFKFHKHALDFAEDYMKKH